MQPINKFPQKAAWLWLFPLTYLVHIAEEYWGGFHQWLMGVTGGVLTAGELLNLNIFLWLVMTAGIALAWWSRAGDWLAIAFGTVVLINALLHIFGSIFTRSYSPGAISGLLLWLPLGAFTLQRGWRNLPRTRFLFGLLVGVVLHTLVSLSAFNLAQN